MRNLRRAAWTACLATLILFGCTRSRAAAPARDGGTMNGVAFRRLGKVVLGNQRPSSKDSTDSVDARPIVLWHGSTPAAVLYRRVHSRALGISWEERIERCDQQPGESWIERKRGPFPLVFGSPWSLTGKKQASGESFDTASVVTADVNGDGVDELLLPRFNGAIGVYSVEKLLFQQPALTAPAGMRYRVQSSFTAKLKDHDVVLFLLALGRDEDGDVEPGDRTKVDQYAILRVDQRGVTRIPLPRTTVPIFMASAVGALNRPGSTDLDEILLLYAADNHGPKMYLSRQRPDGSTIAPPRMLYVDIDFDALRFLFLRETAQAIVANDQRGHVYFMQPEKAANWITDIDLHPLPPAEKSVQVLYAMDPGSDPKVVIAKDAGEKQGPDSSVIYAINREGKCLRPGPAPNTWQPMPNLEPFLRLTSPSKYHWFAGLLPQPGTDILLAVYSRENGAKVLTEEDILSAADAFLQPELVAERRKRYLAMTMKDFNAYPSRENKERKRKGITKEVSTVEEWQAILPDSYQQVLDTRKGQLITDLRIELEAGLRDGMDALKLRDGPGYEAWLKGLKLTAQTVFQVIRGAQVVATFDVPGFVPSALESNTMGLPFDFRTDAAGVGVVLPMDITPSPEATKQPLGFFQVSSIWKTN